MKFISALAMAVMVSAAAAATEADIPACAVRRIPSLSLSNVATPPLRQQPSQPLPISANTFLRTATVHCQGRSPGRLRRQRPEVQVLQGRRAVLQGRFVRYGCLQQRGRAQGRQGVKGGLRGPVDAESFMSRMYRRI
ncbi:hypothetical protein MPH_06864 [Macrophomina phaseolina MS6]|uniref:Uncharacterized protein n=1 Tax=Macrophomina phaseolina (strain MS6) TaxID=1126212 RepID=K2S080_MACPH|nr:hypothetical protein MPH_06864 [Macrophomina phaseolina MS6]